MTTRSTACSCPCRMPRRKLRTRRRDARRRSPRSIRPSGRLHRPRPGKLPRNRKRARSPSTARSATAVEMTPRHQTKGPPSAGLFVGGARTHFGKTAAGQSSEASNSSKSGLGRDWRRPRFRRFAAARGASASLAKRPSAKANQDEHAMYRVTKTRGHRVGRRHQALLVFVVTLGVLALAGSGWPDTAHASAGPMQVDPPPPIPSPRDRPFRGAMTLAVTATDTDHQVFTVHEVIPVQHAGDIVLLYPEWETGSHAPTASAIELAGLVVNIDGRRTEWHRDPINSHAIHIAVPNGAQAIALDFQFLAAHRAALLRADMVDVEWQRLLLYPSGWYVRDIPVQASVRFAPGMRAFSALAVAHQDGARVAFAPVTLDKLVDAPVYAGRYWRQFALSPGSSAPVRLDVIADAPSQLAITHEQVSRLKMLVAQTLKVFGPAPYRHYDMLVSLSDELRPGGGIEHLEEGENNLPADYFSDSAAQLDNKDLIAHELVHAWNGRIRQPAGLWSADFNAPVDGRLLWVYEGQTEFWGRVLAARAGLRTRAQTL